MTNRLTQEQLDEIRDNVLDEGRAGAITSNEVPLSDTLALLDHIAAMEADMITQYACESKHDNRVRRLLTRYEKRNFSRVFNQDYWNLVSRKCTPWERSDD